AYAVALAMCPLFAALWPMAAHAQAAGPQRHGDSIAAFGALGRDEIAATVLILGMLLFAVVTAVVLVRTWVRAAATEAAYRDRIATLTAERDRFNVLLLSEPQILASWIAADDEPDILGDISLVTDTSEPQRVLAFGAW